MQPRCVSWRPATFEPIACGAGHGKPLFYIIYESGNPKPEKAPRLDRTLPSDPSYRRSAQSCNRGAFRGALRPSNRLHAAPDKESNSPTSYMNEETRNQKRRVSLIEHYRPIRVFDCRRSFATEARFVAPCDLRTDCMRRPTRKASLLRHI